MISSLVFEFIHYNKLGNILLFHIKRLKEILLPNYITLTPTCYIIDNLKYPHMYFSCIFLDYILLGNIMQFNL